MAKGKSDPVHDLIYGLFVFALGRCCHFLPALTKNTVLERLAFQAISPPR
jgi:hypothetical protein